MPHHSFFRNLPPLHITIDNITKQNKITLFICTLYTLNEGISMHSSFSPRGNGQFSTI